MYSAFRWESFLLALMRYAAYLSFENTPGLVWAISASRFQVRRFDCSFIFTYPVQTSVGRT